MAEGSEADADALRRLEQRLDRAAEAAERLLGDAWPPAWVLRGATGRASRCRPRPAAATGPPTGASGAGRAGRLARRRARPAAGAAGLAARPDPAGAAAASRRRRPRGAAGHPGTDRLVSGARRAPPGRTVGRCRTYRSSRRPVPLAAALERRAPGPALTIETVSRTWILTGSPENHAATRDHDE